MSRELILVFIGIFIFIAGIVHLYLHFIKRSGNPDFSEFSILKGSLLEAFLLCVTLVFYYFLFFVNNENKNIVRQDPPVESFSTIQHFNNVSDEKTDEELAKDAEAKKHSLLKDVEREGAEKERQEANDYINSALKRAESSN